jgi:hypothetical protein
MICRGIDGAIMKNKFVADGPQRHWLGKRALASESIEKKHASEPANAGPDEKEKIRERMREEHRRREKALNHKPSAGTLW